MFPKLRFSSKRTLPVLVGLITIALFGLLRFLLAPDARMGFSRNGLEPLDVKVPQKHQSLLMSDSCKECHKEEFEDWSRSRHKAAWENEIFQHGFKIDTQTNCIHCHAPLKEQTEEAMINFKYYQTRYPGSVISRKYAGQKIEKEPEHKTGDGVNCAVCHIRESSVLTANNDMGVHQLHGIDKNKKEQSRVACGNCHSGFGGPVPPAPSSFRVKNQDGSINRYGCAGCHETEGGTVGKPYFHTIKSVPVLKESHFCSNCHEFNIPASRNGSVIITDEPMQATHTEWLSYTKKGGTDTCQSCHMPEGNHLFRGAHDLELLKKSVSVSAKRIGDEIIFTLESVDTGHENPTGDLLRHYTFEVAGPESPFQTIYWIGRTFHMVADEKTGEISKRLKSNTSLKPFEPLVLKHREKGPLRWRLRYHYSSAKDELRGDLPLDQIIKTVQEGNLPPEDARR